MALTELQTKCQCYKCVWFHETTAYDPEGPTPAKGECRYHAPRPYLYQPIGVPGVFGTNYDYPSWDQTHWKWPQCDGDWFCAFFHADPDKET